MLRGRLMINRVQVDCPAAGGRKEFSCQRQTMLAAERIGGGSGVLEIGEQDAGKDADFLLRRPLIASERSLSLSERDFQTCFYDAELEGLIDRENAIRQALANIAADVSDDHFYVQYQPIIDLNTEAC